jgi:hypothetical protein
LDDHGKYNISYTLGVKLCVSVREEFNEGCITTVSKETILTLEGGSIRGMENYIIMSFIIFSLHQMLLRL